MALLSPHVLDDECFVFYKADVDEIIAQKSTKKLGMRAINQF